MLACGSTLVQVASAILLHGYLKIPDLLPTEYPYVVPSHPINKINGYQIQKDKCTRCNACIENTIWCDALSYDTDGIPFISDKLCEKCGWCAGRCPTQAISFF